MAFYPAVDTIDILNSQTSGIGIKVAHTIRVVYNLEPLGLVQIVESMLGDLHIFSHVMRNKHVLLALHVCWGSWNLGMLRTCSGF